MPFFSRSPIGSFPLFWKVGVLGMALLVGVVLEVPAQQRPQEPLGERIIYKTVDGKDLSLYVLQPSQPAVTPHAAIIFFHGGGWVGGPTAQFNYQARYLAARGMAAIQVEYRLIGAHGTPQVCVEDAKSSVRWVRAHAKSLHIDPDKIAESGGSAGGYLAAFAAMVPGWDDPGDNLQISPRANLLVLFNPVIDNSPSGFGYARFGADYKKYSPFFYASAHTPPTLILSGSADRLIHATALQTFKQSLDKAGVHAKLILYPNVGHGFFNREPYLTQTTQAMADFLHEYGYLENNSKATEAQSR